MASSAGHLKSVESVPPPLACRGNGDRVLPPSAPLVEEPGGLTAHRRSLPALTGIRYFAAMYVVLFHSKLPEALLKAGLRPASNFILNGNLAVPLFFVLSGLILSYTYEGQIETKQGKRRFWEARFARIWPLYFVSLILSTLCNHTTPHWPSALATVFMVQAWNPMDAGMAGSWNFVCWTLSTEAFFYLVFPFLQRLLEKRSHTVLLLYLLLFVGIAVSLSTGNMNYSDTHGIRYIPLAVLHLPEFLAGVCCGNLYLHRLVRVSGQRRKPLLLIRGLASWAAVLCSIYLLCHLEHSYSAWIGAAFPLLLFGLAAEATSLRRVLSTRAAVVGGQISYGMYLLQWPCKAEVNVLCNDLHIRSMPARFVIDCVVLMLISYAGFHLVEEPARRFIRAGFARAERVRSGASAAFREAGSLQTHA